MVAAVPLHAGYPIEEVQRRFLQILPRVELHARISSRDIKCQHKWADFISEAVSMCWKWWVRLHERGKDPSGFVSTLASLAARHVRSGRRLCGQEKPNDVLSPRAQQMRSFVVEKLPDFSTLNGTPLEDALHDNMRSPIPDQVCFRVDFPAWLRSYSRRNRAIAKDMAMGEPTKALASKFKMSPGRISQLRREFHDDWQRFTEPTVNVAG